MPVHAKHGTFDVEFDELVPENVIRLRKATFDALTAPAEVDETEAPSVPTEEGIDEAPCEDAEEEA